MMGMYGLLGEKLGHSRSPEIHRELGGYDYALIERGPSSVVDFIRSDGWTGLNVTIPYKKTAYALCSVVSPTAEKCGSVNTLVRRDGKIYGYNTDYFGFTATVLRSGVQVRGKKCLVLGSGGAAGAVRAALLDLGAAETVSVSRSGPVNYSNVTDHADARIIVNATPVGMFPNGGASPLTLDPFPRLEAVFDLIYNPLRTRLILDAAARGIPASGGLYMLAAQAKKSSDLFLGVTRDDSLIGKVYEKIALDISNIVLVGMPGSGKSTVGRLAAERLGRDFVDTDEEVERAAGISVPEIFARYGESAFRDLESKAVAGACTKTGSVVAVGGGAVLRAENRELLRQNGRVFLLEREPRLLAREGRPLSAGSLDVMAAERRPFYLAAADESVPNDGSPDEAAARIIESFGGSYR